MPDSSGIEHEQVAPGDQSQKIRKPGLHQLGFADAGATAGYTCLASGPNDGQQPASLPVWERLLCDQLWREGIIEVGGAEPVRRQRSSPVLPAASGQSGGRPVG